MLLPDGMVHVDWQTQRTLLQNLLGPEFPQSLEGPEVHCYDDQSLVGPGKHLCYYIVYYNRHLVCSLP